ncbi:MAG: hypothetical protein QOH74_1957 [Gaiellales bacterium]|nr:hypothetical protein [Gaiellales bacterium]
MTDREGHDLERGFTESTMPPFNNGMTASESDFAADLSAVQADDALLDALGGSDPKIADGLGDQELNALLLAWRRDIDSEPLAELVDTDTAVSTVKTAALAKRHGHRERRRRMLVPVAAAAAVLAIAFTGTGLAARDAQPGDTLWGLTKVLYGDHARSIEAAAAARVDLEKANIALASGRIDDARKALDDAQAALRQVSVEDHLAQLMEQHRQLSAQLESPNPVPLPPATQSPANSSQTSQLSPPPSPSPTSSQLPADTGSGTTTTPSSPPTSTSSPPTQTSEPTPTSSTTPSASGSDPGSSSSVGPRFDVSDNPSTATTP